MQHTMKNILLLPLLSLLLPGCLEFEIATEVLDDASMTRSITITGDSAEVMREEYPFRIDNQWSRSYDTTADGKLVLTAQRHFADVDAMNAALLDSAGILLRISASLEASFDWFFTRYTYVETWHQYDPFGNIPLTDFLSPEEMELARAHVLTDAPFESAADSLALEGTEGRFDEWRLRNMFESYYTIFLEGARILRHPDLRSEDIEAHKDRLYEAGATPLEQSGIDRSAQAFAAVMNTEAVHDAFAVNAQALEQFSAKRDMADIVWKHDYTNRITLPGILQETNAPAIEGNSAVWTEFINLCYIDDVRMTVESRTVNWWMIILLVIIVVMLLLSLIVSIFRKRRSNIPRW